MDTSHFSLPRCCTKLHNDSHKVSCTFAAVLTVTVLTFPHGIMSLWSATGLQCGAHGILPLMLADGVSWSSTALLG